MEGENKKSTQLQPVESQPGDDWGAIHCAECEAPVAHFPPDVVIDEDVDLELYCGPCKGKLTTKAS